MTADTPAAASSKLAKLLTEAEGLVRGHDAILEEYRKAVEEAEAEGRSVDSEVYWERDDACVQIADEMSTQLATLGELFADAPTLPVVTPSHRFGVIAEVRPGKRDPSTAATFTNSSRASDYGTMLLATGDYALVAFTEYGSDDISTIQKPN